MAGKTITTFLVDWNPRGVKTIELSGWTWKAIQIPRAQLRNVKDRHEIHQHAIYFLFWEDEQWKEMVYIWETEDLFKRLIDHEMKKDFWNIIIAFVAKDKGLMKWDIQFLESKLLEEADKAWRYKIENPKRPKSKNLPEFQLDANLQFLENIDLLISTLGFPLLKHIDRPTKDKEQDWSFYLQIDKVSWEWLYSLPTNTFLILEGSRWRLRETIAFKWKAKNMRDELIAQWVIRIENENIVFTKDYEWSSPSFAAAILAGRPINGWTEWKTKDWKTLDEIERKNLK